MSEQAYPNARSIKLVEVSSGGGMGWGVGVRGS